MQYISINQIDGEKMNDSKWRSRILTEFGAKDAEVKELLFYNQNRFDRDIPLGKNFTQSPHVPVWREYAAEAERMGAFRSLQQRLIPLRFPIQAGISQTKSYRTATKKGIFPQLATATGLELTQPEELELKIHPTEVGAIPVLMAANRQDFITLIQALTKRNEPVTFADSMGACIVGGYNNWDRIARYKQQWLDAGGQSDR